MTPEERQMIDLKYRAKAIGQMNQSEISKWSKALLIKIHVITGWVIPENELMNILLDQFEKKLVEDYKELNPDEIEYAFRSKGTTVEDWGKAMNLNLVDKILIPYVNQRFELSGAEERQKQAPPTQKIYSDEENRNLQRQETQACYLRFLKGNKNYFPKGVMTEILLHDKMIQPGTDVEEFFIEKAKAGARNIYEPV